MGRGMLPQAGLLLCWSAFEKNWIVSNFRISNETAVYWRGKKRRTRISKLETEYWWSLMLMYYKGDYTPAKVRNLRLSRGILHYSDVLTDIKSFT